MRTIGLFCLFLITGMGAYLGIILVLSHWVFLSDWVIVYGSDGATSISESRETLLFWTVTALSALMGLLATMLVFRLYNWSISHEVDETQQ